MDTRGDDLQSFSRVDAEISLAILKARSVEFYALLRPHGRWRRHIPKADRIPPRTLQKEFATYRAMLETMYDWLQEDAPRPS